MYFKIPLIKEDNINIQTEIHRIPKIPTELNKLFSYQDKKLIICNPVVFNSLQDQDGLTSSTEISEQSSCNELIKQMLYNNNKNKSLSTVKFNNLRRLFDSKVCNEINFE